MSEAVKFQISYYGPGGPGEAEGLKVGRLLLLSFFLPSSCMLRRSQGSQRGEDTLIIKGGIVLCSGHADHSSPCCPAGRTPGALRHIGRVMPPPPPPHFASPLIAQAAPQVAPGSPWQAGPPTPCPTPPLISTAQEGDVLVSNHPQLAGGSHLPDITVVTPVFNEGSIVFFVASRGHHAGEGPILRAALEGTLQASRTSWGQLLRGTTWKVALQARQLLAALRQLPYGPGHVTSCLGICLGTSSSTSETSLSAVCLSLLAMHQQLCELKKKPHPPSPTSPPTTHPLTSLLCRYRRHLSRQHAAPLPLPPGGGGCHHLIQACP
jgi:hypothetical protein